MKPMFKAPGRGPRREPGASSYTLTRLSLCLKAPGTKCLNLKYDKLLSSFAFNFKLRRYIKAELLKTVLADKIVKRVGPGG